MGCLTISAKAVPCDIHIAAENKNVRLKLTAGLVCGVDLDTYEFLRVNEGPLIVEDGYLKVKRKLQES